MKKEIVKKIVIKNEALESYKQKEIVNQEKRNKCFEENIKRKITSSKFEKLMYIYEQEGYELKLQRSLLEKEIYNQNSLLKRLDCLFLILSFLDGIEKMVIKTSDGEKKLITLQEIYFYFLDLVLESEKESLELEHKIMQLYMLLKVEKEDHPFYLTKEHKNLVFGHILENKEKVAKVTKRDIKESEINFDSMSVASFFNLNIHEVYEQLFERMDLERKIIKQ